VARSDATREGKERRRRIVGALAAALASPAVSLAQTTRAQRLCWLGAGGGRGEKYNVAFADRLRELGFVENQNLVIDFRTALGQPDKLPRLAAEAARTKCDLVFAPGPEAVLAAARQSTRTEPIVVVANDYDPVAAGHIANLARPGGRLTGVSMLLAELPAKRLEVLKELLPQVKRVAVLGDGSTKGQLARTQSAAERMGIELVVYEFQRTPYDFNEAFVQFALAKAEAVLVLASGNFVPARQWIPPLALKHRLPSMFNNDLWPEAGGLASYGPDFPANYRRAAEQAARILRGAKAGEIPFEQAPAVELVLNLRTARALAIEVSPAMRARADRVIE
jgi:putative tryptophan/tyrosine transport system substrate-binding protein